MIVVGFTRNEARALRALLSQLILQTRELELHELKGKIDTALDAEQKGRAAVVIPVDTAYDAQMLIDRLARQTVYTAYYLEG